MSGFAGLRPAKRRKRGASVSKRAFQNLGAECAGLVVGPAVLIVESGGPIRGGQPDYLGIYSKHVVR